MANRYEDAGESRQRSTRVKNTKRRKGRRNRRIVILLMEMIVLAVVFVGYYAMSKWDMMEHITLANEDIVINEDVDESYFEEISKGYTNFAIFGVDARENETTTVTSGVNCDVIIIVSLNNDTGEVKLASVFRDTYTEMPDGTYNKINHALAKWDATAEMNTLNKNLDLDIANYVVVSWSSVANAINYLGGIDVDVPAAMFNGNVINGYITATVEATGIGSTHLTGPGLQHLDGIQSVAYCRVRKIDSDFKRTERQREVIGKMLEKAKTMNVQQFLELVDGILPQVATSMNPADVLSMASHIADFNIGGTVGWPFYQQSVANFRYRDWWPVIPLGLDVNVSQLHEFLFGEEHYVPSSTVQTISQRIISDTGLGTPAETTPVAKKESEPAQN